MAVAESVLITLLTLNIWGLPDAGYRVLSPLRPERVNHICEELKQEHWDVVLLQEVWTPEDRTLLSENCGYPHAVDREDPSRPIDSGLLILSKHPVEEVQRLTFPSSSEISAIFEEGESLARKSALLLKVLHPTLGPIWVANTHLISFYGEGTQDTYLEARRQQWHGFASWVAKVTQGEPVIVGGDWNFGKESPLWTDLQQTLPGYSQLPNSACTICPPNVFQKTDQGKVDHLFASPHFIAVDGGLKFHLPFEFSGLDLHASDHFGWETGFRFRNPPP